MRSAAAARPPERILGLCAFWLYALFFWVELFVELLEAAVAEKFAKVPGPGIGADAALALNCSRVFDPSAGGLHENRQGYERGAQRGEHALNYHNHAGVAVLCLLAEEPHRQSIVDVYYDDRSIIAFNANAKDGSAIS